MNAVANPELLAQKPIGEPMDRVDGRLKVTGGAKYAAEFPVERLAYGFIVQSTIPAGTITKIDVGEARRAPGVVDVLTNENAPRLMKANAQSSGGSGQQNGGQDQ